MSLPQKDNLKSFEYGFDSGPFITVPAKAAIDTKTFEYGFDSGPFITNPYGGGAPPAGLAHVKTWCGVPFANIKTLNGVAVANIKSVDGIT